MKISMLMGTLNRKELMLRAIESVLSQSHKDFQIIIIDQSEEDNEISLPNDDRIRYFHIAEKGLSHARNVGLQYATGDIIGLMDDDAVYEKYVLEKVNNLFEQDNKLGLVSGCVRDFVTNEISLKGMSTKKLNIVKKNIFRCCISPSMFIKKEVFHDNLFDEQLGLGAFWGSGEETDIALQAIYKDFNALFCPDIVVFHPTRIKQIEPFEKVASYSRGFGAVCAKHVHLFGNKTMKYLYKRALFRAIGGYLLSILKFSSHMRQYYKISFRAKREGYRTYRQHLRGEK